uniref:Uncharacterized protein n=1 Tax=Streptomyces avermitilis TaxID=33903 RepID=A0A499W9U7_STRAX|nr:hypothetical protein SAVMC3_89760 [Streptomyces avermitilis]
MDRRPRPTKITSGSVGLIHDREVEACHLLPVEPLSARQSSLQRPANLPLTHRVVEVLAVHQGGVRGEHDHGPAPAHRASWIGLVVVRTPNSFSTGSFSSEHTATMGER